MSTDTTTKNSAIEVVTETLEEFAGRGVFKGFACGKPSRGNATYRMKWHRDQMFEFIFDPRKNTMRFPIVLPQVPGDSEMYKQFKDFVKSRQSETLPDHRRIDPAKAIVKPLNRGGNVSLTLTLQDGDYDYGVRKLIHLVHEIYLAFLIDGHYDYMVEVFDLDPDHP